MRLQWEELGLLPEGQQESWAAATTNFCALLSCKSAMVATPQKPKKLCISGTGRGGTFNPHLSGRHDIYEELSPEQREPLKQALEKLFAAEKTRDWETVYSLVELAENDEAFVAKMKTQHALREFLPTKLTFMPPEGSWNIQGCASFAGDLDGRGHVADLRARWKDSRWYLSVISFVPFGTEKKAALRACPMT